MRGELLEAERVHSIVGGFFAVYNYYGYGPSERVYAGALEHELQDRVGAQFGEMQRAASYHYPFAISPRHRTTSAVHPVWWLAPRPRPVSP